LSVPDKLLLAALALEETGRTPFTAEDLVVNAWKGFPDTFALAGYHAPTGASLYPDSNRVFAEIMGSKPIRQRGLLVKVGNKMYQLTEAGRERARLLAGRVQTVDTGKAGLPRDIEAELRRLLGCKAVGKHRGGRASDLTFHDACAFWGISPRSSAIEVQGRFANLLGVIDAGRNAARERPVSFSHGGPSYGSLEMDALVALHEELLRRFDAELQVIGKRKDER
jgi:hypothetical protein